MSNKSASVTFSTTQSVKDISRTVPVKIKMITDSNSSISLFTGFLYVNIVAHHRLQTIVEQCIKYLIHASAIRDFKLVIALVLYIVHMASDSGADTG